MADVPHVPPHSAPGHHAFNPDGFGRKLGPFPIWGWAILLAAAVFIYVKFFGGAGGGSTAASGTDLSGLGSNAGSLSPGTGSSTDNNPSTSYLDNSAWENAAIGEASQFGATPLDVQQAVENYLNGGTLSQTQGSLINRILGSLGAAPLGTQGTPTITPPPSQTPPKTTTATATLKLPAGTAIYSSSSAGAKNLINLNTGKVTHVYSAAEWAKLRKQYGNNIPITTVNAAVITKAGGRN